MHASLTGSPSPLPIGGEVSESSNSRLRFRGWPGPTSVLSEECRSHKVSNARICADTIPGSTVQTRSVVQNRSRRSMYSALATKGGPGADPWAQVMLGPDSEPV